MQTKKQSAYECVLQCMKEKWNDLGCTAKFSRLLTDFESAEMMAVASVFGDDKVWCTFVLKTCLIHILDLTLACNVSHLGRRVSLPLQPGALPQCHRPGSVLILQRTVWQGQRDQTVDPAHISFAFAAAR